MSKRRFLHALVSMQDFRRWWISQHLTQLSAGGFLNERRSDGAKCFALNLERIIDTLQAIRNFLLIGERSLT